MADYNLGTARGRVGVDYDGKGIGQAKKDFEGFGRSARGVGADLDEVANKTGIAAVGIAAGLGLATKTAVDFEKQISAIGAVSGATVPQLEALRAKALQIGKDTAFGATDAALAMEELAKAGIPIESILNGAADATVNLAAAGGVQLPQAAELAADAMNAFGLSAQDMPKIADLIAGAANASSISVSDFQQSLTQVGAVAKLVGLDFKDTATAIALMGQAGIKGSDAGTSLKTMLQNLQPVTKGQVQLFKELGLVTADGSNKFFDQKGKLKSLSDIAGILNTSMKGMTDQQKALALETIFGSDAIRAAAVLTDQGAAGFDKMATAMGKVTAEEVAAARLDNTAGAIERLKGSAETAAISLGTLLLPAVERIAKGLEAAANWFNGLSDSTKGIIVNTALVVAGLLGIVAAGIKIARFVSTIRTIVAAMKAWHILTKTIAIATKAWAAVQWLLNAAMSANPIGLIIAAIIGLIAIIVLLWKKNEGFRKVVMAVWNAIKAAIGAVADWFMGTVWPLLKTAWDGIVAAFKAAWGFIKQVLDFFIAGFQFWWGIIKAIFGFVAPLFQAVFGLIVSVIRTAWAIISAIFMVWKTVMAAIWGPILNAMVAIFTWAFNLVKTIVMTVWNFIKAVTSAVWNAIKAVLSAVWNAIMKVAKVVWDAVMKVITAVWDAIGPYITAAVNAIKAVLDKAWNTIKTVVATVWNAIKAVFNTVWEAIKNIVQGAVNRVIAIINGIKKMVDNVRKFFNELKAAASGGTDSLIAFVKGIPGRILSAIGNLGRLLYQKGRDLIQGLIDGIRAMIGRLRSTAGSVVDAIGRFLPGSPAKEGPLSGKGYVLLRGQRFVDDFATGIMNKAKVARNAMASMIEDAASRMPASSGGTVEAAAAGMASVVVNPVLTPGPSTDNSRRIEIQNFTLQGVWDFSRPGEERRLVARLHQALDDYEREHR